MFLANNRSTGANVGFLDICLTPAAPAPLPIPYLNFGMNTMAFPFSFFVKFTFIPALNLLSKILMTTGDEGGVAHPTFKGTGSYTVGNPFIFIDYAPATHLCCLTTGNNFNNFLGAVLIPCITNVFLTCALPEEQEPGKLSPDAMRRLAGAARGSDDAVRARQLDNGIVLLEMSCVPTRAATMVYRALAAFDNIRAVVLDLRDNPGGDAKAALELANDWLPRGTLMLQLRHADGDIEPVVARHDASYSYPLAVLVNSGTASAAELLAATLGHHGHATVVGSRSLGKSEVQELLPSDQGARYVTVARYLLPDGGEIHGQGVTPQLVSDEPLEAAVRALLA